MSLTEKITMTVFVAAAIVSSALYGVWEDKVLLFGPLLVLLYFSLAVWIVRSQKAKSSFRPPPGGIWMLIFWLYSAIMILFSVLPYEAKISTLRFGCYVGTYWVSANILSRFSRRKAVWLTLLSALILIALYGLVQHKVNPGMLFGMERYTDMSSRSGRLGGTYICPNHIAHLFQMWIPFCLVFLFIPQFGWFWRICIGYAIPLFLVLIYKTQSRAGLLGTVAAVGVTLLFIILQKSRKAFWVALLMIPLLCAGAVGGLYAGSSIFRERMQPVVKFLESRFQEDAVAAEFQDFRPQTWLDTIDMIKARPVFGFGPGNYALTYEDFHKRCRILRASTVHAHNEYLEMTAEYGLVGAALVFGALMSLLAASVRFLRSSPPLHHALPVCALLGAVAGTAVHGFFDFELRIFPNAMMLAVLAGCAVAPILQQQRSEGSGQMSDYRLQATGRRPKTTNYRLWFVVCLLLSVFLLLVAAWSAQVMTSAWIRARGDQLLKKENFDAAERWFQTSEKIDPQNWQAQFGLGQIYFRRRYYELDPALKHGWALKEQAAYAAAYRINSKKEEVRYGLARVELFLGNREYGLQLMRELARYARFDAFYWRKLGIELRRAGLDDEALKTFEYALTLDQSNATVKRNIQWLKKKGATD